MEDNKTIKIFRYGNYITEVDNSEELRKWIINNVPYRECKDMVEIPPTSKLSACLTYATKAGYRFTDVDTKIVTFEEVSRFGHIADTVDIVEVAQDLGFAPIKRGENYVCKCPHCKGKSAMAVSPKRGIYRCFICGETGNSINFVRAVRRVGTEDAINYLESMYINK